MFGLVIVALLVLHMLAVAFLYQKVPPTENVHNLRSAQGMDSILQKSRLSLGRKEAKPVGRFRPQEKKQENVMRRHNARQPKNVLDHHKPAMPDLPNEDKKFPQQKVKKEEPVVQDKEESVDNKGVKTVDDKSDKKENNNDVAKEKQAADESAEVEEKGSRVTDKAYISDFAFERDHPHFRTQEVILPALDARIESLESCGYVSDHRLLTHHACRQEDTLLTAFNHQPFPRYWCGKVIAPNEVQHFDEPCHEPVRLFPMTRDAPVSGEDMPPIVITSTKNSTDLEQVTCDIPCKQQVNMEGITRYIEGTDWKIIATAQDPSTVREAKMDDKAYQNDLYYSTTSFLSSVPQSSFSFDEYNFTTPAVNFDDTLPSASYLIDSDCSPQGSKRHRWVGAVQKHFAVAFYGSCTHNTDVPQGMSLSNKNDRVALHRKHRFNLAFESSNEKDYMTNVIFDAFQSGSLPVILGPSNIESHFPPNSFINAGRFQYWDDLGQYVKKVAENKSLWESYHEWRKDPNALKSFRERLNFTRTSTECRMCRWAYAKKYGLGWDHVQQVVRENALSRNLCVDSELVTKPFVESYTTKTDDTYEAIAAGDKESITCHSDSHSLHAAFDLNGFQVERTVEAHDGVTDLVFNHIGRPNAGSDIILRLEFQVKNAGGASFPHPHTLVSTIRGPLCSSIAFRDERSKVTILANWETVMTSTKEGTIEIVLHSGQEGNLQEDETRRIRVIVEDVSVINDKLTEYFPSSFAKLMIHDFVDPLELFYNTN